MSWLIFSVMRSWKSGWKRYRLPSTATVTLGLLMRFNKVAMPKRENILVDICDERLTDKHMNLFPSSK